MALKSKSDGPKQQPEEAAAKPTIAAVENPPSPLKEIASLRREIEDLKRAHDVELTRERQTTERYKRDAEEARTELNLILESPLIRVLHNGGNLPDIEERFQELCAKCAEAGMSIKGKMDLKIEVASGRNGEGSVEFNITDKVTNPVEDTGACILWMQNGKLSESSAKQRDLLDVKPGPRRPNPSPEDKLAAAHSQPKGE
jgi:hypothetical protein